ncbi:MAG: VWA domain-containing protein [bacterium]
MANAQNLKDQGVVVFVIGLGNVDRTFLGQLASGPDFVFYTPDSSELDALFQQVAQQIQLRLVR